MHKPTFPLEKRPASFMHLLGTSHEFTSSGRNDAPGPKFEPDRISVSPRFSAREYSRVVRDVIPGLNRFLYHIEIVPANGAGAVVDQATQSALPRCESGFVPELKQRIIQYRTGMNKCKIVREL
jgi:hypothetical protein